MPTVLQPLPASKLKLNHCPKLPFPIHWLTVGNTITLSPETGGTWISSNPAVAAVSGATVTGYLGRKRLLYFYRNCHWLLKYHRTPVTDEPNPKTIC
jgi:hypothetical protein